MDERTRRQTRGESDADTMAAMYVAAARQAWAHIYGDANLETLRLRADA